MALDDNLAAKLAALPDVIFSLELGAQLGAIETRKTGTTSRCRECDSDVEVVEDRIPIRTSYGMASTWRSRAAYTHRRDCFESADARSKQRARSSDFDLYDRG